MFLKTDPALLLMCRHTFFVDPSSLPKPVTRKTAFLSESLFLLGGDALREFHVGQSTSRNTLLTNDNDSCTVKLQDSRRGL